MDKPLNYTRFIISASHLYTKMGAYKPEAVLAAAMATAHESKGGTYWKQINGPALGPMQIEPTTHDSIWNYCDNIHTYADRCGITQNLSNLEKSLDYNLFMTRCYFIMDVNPFPKDVVGMAEYLKDYWNSEGGKATPKKYLNDYNWWLNAKNTKTFDEQEISN